MELDILVIGAGITGLTTAYRCAQKGWRVAIIEQSERWGGVIQSEREGGYLIECGPNSFSSFPEDGLQLVKDLGLEDRAQITPMKEHERFIWKKGKLRKVPTSPPAFLFSNALSPLGKLRTFFGLFLSGKPLKQDIELGKFFRQRIGNEAVDSLLKPFMAGVYAADADRVSFETTFPKLYAPARKGLALKDMMKSLRENTGAASTAPTRALISFPKGLIELADKLAKEFKAKGGTIYTEEWPLIKRKGTGQWEMYLESADQTLKVRHVVLATPAEGASEIIAPLDADSAEAIEAIEYAPLTVVHVGASESQFTDQRNGFGFLTVPDGQVKALGMIWNDRIFKERAPEGKRLMTCFYGGEKDPEACAMDDDAIRQAVEQDLRLTLGFQGGDFDVFKITRWDKSLPVFRVGHTEKINKVLKQLPKNLHLLGNFLGGVSIPERVASANRLANELDIILKGGSAPVR